MHKAKSYYCIAVNNVERFLIPLLYNGIGLSSDLSNNIDLDVKLELSEEETQCRGPSRPKAHQ
jgi:hypothetical protein